MPLYKRTQIHPLTFDISPSFFTVDDYSGIDPVSFILTASGSGTETVTFNLPLSYVDFSGTIPTIITGGTNQEFYLVFGRPPYDSTEFGYIERILEVTGANGNSASTLIQIYEQTG